MKANLPSGKFYVKGTAQEVAAHERLVRRQILANTTNIAVPYVTAVLFALIAAALIMFAPDSRGVAANIAAFTFLVLSAGIAGYTRVMAKAPGFEVEAGETRAPLKTTPVPNEVAEARRILMAHQRKLRDEARKEPS